MKATKHVSSRADLERMLKAAQQRTSHAQENCALAQVKWLELKAAHDALLRVVAVKLGTSKPLTQERAAELWRQAELENAEGEGTSMALAYGRAVLREHTLAPDAGEKERADGALGKAPSSAAASNPIKPDALDLPAAAGGAQGGDLQPEAVPTREADAPVKSAPAKSAFVGCAPSPGTEAAQARHFQPLPDARLRELLASSALRGDDDQQFQAFLDSNIITPTMTCGELRSALAELRAARERSAYVEAAIGNAEFECRRWSHDHPGRVDDDGHAILRAIAVDLRMAVR